MLYIEYSKLRYRAALSEIDRLKQAEFPYPQIRDALLKLEDVFQDQLVQLAKLTPKSTPAIAKNACSLSLAHLFNYTPFLGFILRATNVRNAFEIYAPVLRLARRLLNANTKLLLSSEWDYSPFVYLPTAHLPEFVLIGVPAFESGNPLLVSLAGHELGHNVWNQQMLGTKFDPKLRNEVLTALKGTFWAEFQGFYSTATHGNLQSDMFLQQAWLPAHAYAKLQLEEVFCDMMGLRLFAEAYLHAFAYLLSPCPPGERTASYPNIRNRVDYMLRACGPLGIAAPPGYSELFEPQAEPSSPVKKLLVAVADRAVAIMFPAALDEAMQIAEAKRLAIRRAEGVSRVTKDLRMVMPAEGTLALTDIINAGWVLFHDADLWKEVSQIRYEDRTRVLFDLILKSCEVAEVSERIGA